MYVKFHDGSFHFREGDETEVCALSNDNLLLAGTVLKVLRHKQTYVYSSYTQNHKKSENFFFQNTREVYAACVYAGTQTKISLNSKITKNKFSSIERSLNK